MTPRPEKTAAPKRTASPGRPVTYRAVLAALQSDFARSSALALYRCAGYRPDDFAFRRPARLAMADALTATEDALELRGARRERAAVRVVRRLLESEVWS